MRTKLLAALLVLAGCGSHPPAEVSEGDGVSAAAPVEDESSDSDEPAASEGLHCGPNQVAVPAGGHCQECGPLDGCSASPATCRPACTRQADCGGDEGNCDIRVGACVRLCG